MISPWRCSPCQYLRHHREGSCWVGEMLTVGENVDLAALAQQVGLSLKL